MSIYTKVSHFLSCPSTLRSATSYPVHIHQGQPLPVPSSTPRSATFCSAHLQQGQPLVILSINSKVSHFLSRLSTARSATCYPVHLHQSQPLPVLSSHTQGLQVRSKSGRSDPDADGAVCGHATTGPSPRVQQQPETARWSGNRTRRPLHGLRAEAKGGAGNTIFMATTGEGAVPSAPLLHVQQQLDSGRRL